MKSLRRLSGLGGRPRGMSEADLDDGTVVGLSAAEAVRYPSPGCDSTLIMYSAGSDEGSAGASLGGSVTAICVGWETGPENQTQGCLAGVLWT